MEPEIKKKIIGKNVIALLIVIIIAMGILVAYQTYATTTSTEIILKGDSVTLEVGSEYEEPGFTANINETDATNRVTITTNLNTNRVGDYNVTYHLVFNYLKMEKTATRIVHVVDTTKPELTIQSDKKITMDVDSEFTYPTYTAIDNYDGDITEYVKVETDLNTKQTGTYEIKYTVTDSHKNETTDSIQVKVRPKKNAHIIVSISKQTLTYYEYGEAVLSSSVVTGINGKTPTGTFKVLYKARDVILKGADYESFVSYWMAFKGNSFGFHDASWRSKFGGTIYKTNGSHGCVNMPYNKVKQLYNMVAVGTPVYIQK